MRCFISIDIPKEIHEEIKNIQNSLPEFLGRKTKLENLHLTLKFLGEVDEKTLEKVKEKLKEIKLKRFESKIDLIGVFSENFIRIIWLHLSNCGSLQKKVDRSLEGLFNVEDRFMSHLTIARVKKVNDKKKFLQELRKIKFSKVKFNVNGFKLKKSNLGPEGPVYETLECYSLD